MHDEKFNKHSYIIIFINMDVIADNNIKLRLITSFLTITISIVILIYSASNYMIVSLMIIILIIKIVDVYLQYKK